MGNANSMEVGAEENVEVHLPEGAAGTDPDLEPSDEKCPYMDELEEGLDSLDLNDVPKFSSAEEELLFWKTSTLALKKTLDKQVTCLPRNQNIVGSDAGCCSKSLMIKDDKDDSEPKPSIELRNYQKAILKISKHRNTIACLPTGTGKTLIAVELMKEYQSMVISGEKKLLFVVNTVPLVEQQGKYIKDNTTFKVELIVGGTKKSKDNYKFFQKMDFHVLVLTSRICHDLLLHQYLNFNKIALIVFDECHHTVKEHPMNLIMHQYKHISKEDSSYELPRILGLTATILRKTVGVDEMANEIKYVEKRMCSTAITYEAYEEVLKFSTSAELVINKYTRVRKPEWEVDVLLKDFKRIKSFFETMGKTKCNEPPQDVLARLVSKRCLMNDSQNSNDISRELMDLFSHTEHALLELGPRCACIAATNTLLHIEKMMEQDIDERQKVFLNVVSTALRRMMLFYWTELQDNDEIIKALQSATRSDDGAVEDTVATYELYLSNKVCHLLRILRSCRGTEQSSSDLCGIVFVDMRMTAQCLYELIEEAAELMPEIYGFISPALSLGTVKRSTKSSGLRMTVCKQTELLQSFREKKYNLLISTSVLEEGMDVTTCNIVIRFDLIQSYTSYLQSMGRARQRNAQFHVLISEENCTVEREALMNFSRMSSAMTKNLCEKMELLLEGLDSNDVTWDEDDENEVFCPGGTPDSPSVSLASAVSLVNRYCMLLKPVEGELVSKSWCWWESLEELSDSGKIKVLYRAYVRLPPTAAVKDIVQGPLKNNTMLAKKYAYLETCKRLYACGVLNDHLLPTATASS